MPIKYDPTPGLPVAYRANGARSVDPLLPPAKTDTPPPAQRRLQPSGRILDRIGRPNPRRQRRNHCPLDRTRVTQCSDHRAF